METSGQWVIGQWIVVIHPRPSAGSQPAQAYCLLTTGH